MGRSIMVALAIAVAITAWVVSGMLGIGGTDDSPSAAGDDATAVPGQQAKPVPVRTIALSAEPYRNRLRLSGHTEADRTVVLRAEVEGPIATVPAEEGQPVSEGDPIVTIAPRDRAAVLQEARALVRQRQIEYEAADKLAAKGYQSQTSKAGARAALDQAIAQRMRAEIGIANLAINAPFDGMLGQRDAEVGDYVQVGDNIATVMDLSPLRIAVFVSEQDIAQIPADGEAIVRFVDGTTETGRIAYVASSADTRTRTFKVEIEVDNPDARIRAGMTVSVELPLEGTRAHKMSAGLLTLGPAGQIGVMTVDDTARARFLPVDILHHGADAIWLGGLPDHVRVISVGQEFVRDGVAVDATAEPPPAAPAASATALGSRT